MFKKPFSPIPSKHITLPPTSAESTGTKRKSTENTAVNKLDSTLLPEKSKRLYLVGSHTGSTCRLDAKSFCIPIVLSTYQQKECYLRLIANITQLNKTEDFHYIAGLGAMLYVVEFTLRILCKSYNNKTLTHLMDNKVSTSWLRPMTMAYGCWANSFFRQPYDESMRTANTGNGLDARVRWVQVCKAMWGYEQYWPYDLCLAVNRPRSSEQLATLIVNLKVASCLAYVHMNLFIGRQMPRFFLQCIPLVSKFVHGLDLTPLRFSIEPC